MTISATSQGLKPGVCTSSNRPANPYAGMMIFETDTNRLAVYNGSAWVVLADADTPPGLELVKTQTVGTAVSSISVTDAFSSTYDNYLITYNNGASSATDDLRLQLGSTTSGYYSTIFGTSWSATFGAVGTTTGSNFDRIGEVNSTNGVNLFVNIQSPFLSKRTRVQGQYMPTSGGYMMIGMLDNTTSYTGFTIIVGTGTVTGGTIRVYGYRNS